MRDCSSAVVSDEEEEERETRQAIDNGRDDRVCERDDDDESRSRPECTPVDVREGVFDLVDRAWGTAKDEELDVVQDERHNLKEASRSTRETLEDDVREEERGRLW